MKVATPVLRERAEVLPKVSGTASDRAASMAFGWGARRDSRGCLTPVSLGIGVRHRLPREGAPWRSQCGVARVKAVPDTSGSDTFSAWRVR